MDKTDIQISLFTVGAVMAVLLIPNPIIHGSTLEKETLPLDTSGSPIPLNTTADAEDIDITIDPLEDISTPNGTQSISTTGANDIDINDFPPAGVTVVIENKTVSVTENPVTIGEAIDSQVAEQAPAAIEEEIEQNAEE